MDGRGRHRLQGCGRRIDNERYLKLDHRIQRGEATNRPVRSLDSAHVEMTDEPAGPARPCSA